MCEYSLTQQAVAAVRHCDFEASQAGSAAFSSLAASTAARTSAQFNVSSSPRSPDSSRCSARALLSKVRWRLLGPSPSIASWRRSSASSRRRPLRSARARASGPPMPCNASRADTPETPAAPDTLDTPARGAAAPAPRSWLKPSAAVFEAPDAAPADEVDEVELTFIANGSPHPAHLSQLVNDGLSFVSHGETWLKALLHIGAQGWL